MVKFDPKKPRFIIHNDEPGHDKNDCFGQKSLIDSIASTIGKRVTPPFVASLNGDWGQGKTSILEAVYAKLTGVKPKEYAGENPNTNFNNVRVVWFEAWRYQHDPAPIAALLNEIRTQLEKMSRLAKISKSAKKVTEIAIESSLQALVSLTSHVFGFAGNEKLIDTIKKNGNAWEQRNHSYTLPSQSIRELLNKAIEDILQKLVRTEDGTKARLVVIIDDLDRCQPTVAYKLLEGLKIFLNLPSCVFLIGSNRAELVRAIGVGLMAESGMSFDSTNSNHANEYFEKLCSYSWDIPFPTIKDSTKYVLNLLIESNGVTEGPIFKKLGEVFMRVSDPILPANPRRIKAFANTLIRLIEESRANVDVHNYHDSEAEFLLTYAYIATFMPEVNRRILANPKAIRDLHTRAREIYSATGDITEQPATKKGNPIGDKVPTYSQLLNELPETTDIFRMAPIFVECDPPTDDLIHKYLPHGLR